MSSQHIQLPYKDHDVVDQRIVHHELAETIVISGPMEIASGSFNWNKNVKKIIISDDVTGVGNNNFQGFESLEEISFGHGIQYIGDSCFRDLKSIKNSSLRERFKIDPKNSSMISRLLNDTCAIGLIRISDDSTSDKNRKYVPFWA